MSDTRITPKFKLSAQNTKLLVAIISILVFFSGLKIYTGKIRNQAQIQSIELRFENKDPLYMRQALNLCQIDLQNREEVRRCVQSYKNQLLSPYKAEEKKQTIQGYLWWLFWGSVVLFVYTRASNKPSLIHIFSIFKTLFERQIINKVQSIFGRSNK